MANKVNSGLLKATTCELESSGQRWDTVVLVKAFIQQMYWAFTYHAPGSILSAGDSVLEDTEETKISILTEFSFSKLKHFASPSERTPSALGRSDWVYYGRDSIFSRLRYHLIDSEGWFTVEAEGSDGNLRSALLRICTAKRRPGRGRL